MCLPFRYPVQHGALSLTAVSPEAAYSGLLT